PASKSEEARGSPSSEIVGSCACGGVTVKLQRPPPNYKSNAEFGEWVVEDEYIVFSVSRSFADMIFIRHGTPCYASNYCFCNECRRYASAPMFSWIFVPTKLFELSSGKRPDGEDALKGYKSSERVVRRFCSSCGCQISFAL